LAHKDAEKTLKEGCGGLQIRGLNAHQGATGKFVYEPLGDSGVVERFSPNSRSNSREKSRRGQRLGGATVLLEIKKTAPTGKNKKGHTKADRNPGEVVDTRKTSKEGSSDSGRREGNKKYETRDSTFKTGPKKKGKEGGLNIVSQMFSPGG